MLILDSLKRLSNLTLIEVLDPLPHQSTALQEEETLMAQKYPVAVSVLAQKRKVTQQKMVNLIN